MLKKHRVFKENEAKCWKIIEFLNKIGDKVYKGTGNKKIKVTMYPPLKGPAGASQVTKHTGGKKPNLSNYEGGRMTGFNIKRFMK